MTHDQRFLRFAQSYSSETASTLTAYAAIGRIERLLSDAKMLQAIYEAADIPGDSIWFGLEVFSYYPVGFVTCLEWHARARIVDLFTYKPDCVKADDFKTQMNAKFYAQMIAARTPFPELLGAMVSIGSADAYLNVFNRVFSTLDLPRKSWDLVRDIIVVKDADDPEGVPSLFEFRNHLVHEIDSSVVGRPWQRNAKTMETALADGHMAHAVMCRIEDYLSKNAPERFPNLLNADGYPRDEYSGIGEQIKQLEAELAPIFFTMDGEANKWSMAVDAATKSLQQHEEAIESASGLSGTMHIRLRDSLHLANRRRRLEFLMFVKKQVELWGISEEPDEPHGR